jgi:hypothetical protein
MLMKRRKKLGGERAKRSWLLSPHTLVPDVRERRSLPRGLHTGETSEVQEKPCRVSDAREEMKDQWIFRVPLETSQRDEKTYYGEHRSRTAPSSF